MELRERTPEDHATHFTGEILPIVMKQLVTLWQAEHRVLVEPVGAWHVFARSDRGQLMPVRPQPGAV